MEILKQLPHDKVKINFNRNPIPMELFLSFFKVETKKITDHLGASNGWTEYQNKQFGLIITGGICDGGHWLHAIQFGNKLQNQYNNYCNPLYLFDIMNEEGKSFFVEYYKEEIHKVVDKQQTEVDYLEKKTMEAKLKLTGYQSEQMALFELIPTL